MQQGLRKRSWSSSPLRVEQLEDRACPHAASGNLWPHPELVSVSFQPDGTNLGGPSSNLVAQFNSRFGSATAWQNVLLKAFQTYAQYTNLNFTVVADNGTASGGGSYQQGDPGMGDIRIGGFNLNNPDILALAYMPPEVNNYSIAGDIAFNTGKTFNINGLDYDLYTVALHEIGHALGLSHSGDDDARMYPTYGGVEYSLDADDIAGIREIYSNGLGRSHDAFDAAASNGAFASATNLDSQIDAGSLNAVITGLDITATSDVDFYQFTVPEGSSGQATVTVQSSGLSLLAPNLRLYNANQTQIVSVTGTGNLGSTKSYTFNVTPGQTYYVRIAGANTTAFGTGAYALTLKFGSETPVVTPPGTQVANASPTNGGGGVANRRDAEGNVVNSLLNLTGNLVGGLTGLLGRLFGSAVTRVVSHFEFVDVLTIGDGRFEPSSERAVTPFAVSVSPGSAMFRFSPWMWTTSTAFLPARDAVFQNLGQGTSQSQTSLRSILPDADRYIPFGDLPEEEDAAAADLEKLSSLLAWDSQSGVTAAETTTVEATVEGDEAP